MKNAQNECENLVSAPTTIETTTTTTSGASTTTTETLPVPSLTSPVPVRNCSGSAENAHNNARAATAAKNSTKMTDEYNSDNNNDSSSSNSINNNGSLIAEAAKILLKNGLNGTSAAAAALLTAATSFQLPTIPVSSISAATTILPAVDCVGAHNPPLAHVAKLSSIMSSAVAVGHVSQRNNGLPNSSSHTPTKKTSDNDMCLTSRSEGFLDKQIPPTSSADAGVIDYTVSTASNGTQKAPTGFSHGGIGGGRLQFFKDGKFILELARSKDGERGGWVSVPRKHFRQPSATTSTVTPASTANACIYPKMESSTSLSFSDDNSSIQSSPWQRDHCWKQTTPKRNISKEMSVFYKTPTSVTITKAGLRLAKRKRRRPYDETFNELNELKLFECCEDIKCSPNQNCQSINHRHQNGSTIKFDDEDHSCTSSVATLVGDGDCSNPENEGILAQKSDQSSKMARPLSNVEPVDGIQKTKSVEKCEPEKKYLIPNDEERKVKSETDDYIKVELEKMNTSEDGDKAMSMAPDETPSVVKTGRSNFDKDEKTNASKPFQSKTKGVEDKRLTKKKRKERAKLNSIVQKLTDRMSAARTSNLAKMPLLNNSSSSNTQQNHNFLSNKVSPNSSSSSTSPSLVSACSASATATATATTSRLVEYHHHQQHVSPRKRILREFEKVSLEDTAAVSGGAGGKRSRAKSNSNISTSASYRNPANNRVHSSACAVVPATVTAGSNSSISITSTNGESLQNTSSAPTSIKYAKSATASTAPSTRLYSSYSIHSLLGDQSNSTGGHGSTSSVTAKSTEQSSTYNHHNQQQQNTEHSLHARKSVSPKSPEMGGGGKSPSCNNASKKRSPPYSSPKHEPILRSPSVNNSVDYSSRATPPEFNSSSKHRYGASGLPDQAGNSAHQFHRQAQQSVLYSPYLMSPKCHVPGSTSATIGTLSPRNLTTAVTTCITPTPSNANTQQNIPNSYSSQSSSSSSLSFQREQRESQSPSRSIADFSRETTPRTVPKKTASIRRQFASPTALNSERSIEELETKCSNSSIPTSTASYQQLLQQSSTLSTPLQAAAYYMYPPAPPIAYHGNSSAPGGNNVPPTSAYIPSYYHSYLSALNITKHYYMGAGASQSAAAAAAARLSSPFHPMSIPYNGVSAAAVAAAAAAAAATAAFSGQPPMGHHPMLPSSTAATAAALYGVAGGSGFGLGLSAASSSSTNSASQTYKSTDSSAVSQNAEISPETTASASTSNASTHPTHFSSIRDEHSSDVPLNLSKH